VVGLVALTAACSGKTIGEANGPASDAGASGEDGSPSNEQGDGDGNSAVIDSGSTACFVPTDPTNQGCPQSWDAASQMHRRVQPSADCPYLRVTVQGADSWEICLYDARELKLVGGRSYAASPNAIICWGMQSGFPDPSGCQYMPDNCPDASDSEAGK